MFTRTRARPSTADRGEPLPIFLDVEASSLDLGKSYPTEVAWSLPDGGIRCHLVRPAPTWDDWSPRAEQLTGISRHRIEASGRPVREVALAMNRDLARRTVYCDGGIHDRFWVRRLFNTAGVPCHFDLAPVEALSWHQYCALLPPAEVESVRLQARLDAGPAHRADRDVDFLLRFYRALAERASR